MLKTRTHEDSIQFIPEDYGWKNVDRQLVTVLTTLNIYLKRTLKQFPVAFGRPVKVENVVAGIQRCRGSCLNVEHTT